MTDAELTEMLRSSANRVVTYAADRIEALTAERDVSNELGKALEEDAGQLRAERDLLREALESLHGFADGWRECGCGDSCYGRHAERNMVLDHLHDFATAALKGESHD